MRLVTVNVYSYVNPVRLHPVNVTAAWYQEGKILTTESDYRNVIAFKDGYKVRYSVMVYKFRKVAYTDNEIEKLKTMIRTNVKRTYQGWIHHANLYEKIPHQSKGVYLGQISLNFEL